jgi:hypothetical protein
VKRLERGKFIWPTPAASGVVCDLRIVGVRRYPPSRGYGSCFVSISFEGDFQPLAQSLALKTQSGGLNATPVVRMRP